MATRDLKKNLRSSQKKLQDRLDKITSREFREAYTRQLEETTEILTRLLSIDPADLTSAQRAQLLRNSNILTALNERVEIFTGRTRQSVETIARAALDASYATSGWAVNQYVGVNMTFGGVSDRAIAAAVGISGDFNALEGFMPRAEVLRHKRILDRALDVNYAGDMRRRISRAVTDGVIRGEGIPKIRKRLQDALSVSRRQAETIARTEGLRAMSLGSQLAYEEAADQGVNVVQVWDATLDSRTRPDHVVMDGRRMDMETGLFSAPWGSTPGPHRNGIAEQDINCFPGFVHADGLDAEKAYRRKYSGKVKTIECSSGLNFTCTVNHPILTTKGWVSSGDVIEGCNIVSVANSELRDVWNKDINYIPSTFKEVFNLLSIYGTLQRVPGMDEQFHGDGSVDNDVDIVGAKSILADTVKPVVFEQVNEFGFTLSDILLACLPTDGAFVEFRLTSLLASDGIMGFLGELEPFLWRCVSHADKHGLASITALQTELAIIAGNYFPAYTEAFSSSFARFARIVSVDKVVNVNEWDFVGHVYNLQTKDGWYIVSDNGNSVKYAIVHNCRCDSVAEVEGFAPEVRRVRDQGIVPYQTAEQWVQEQGLTVNKYGQRYNFL